MITLVGNEIRKCKKCTEDFIVDGPSRDCQDCRSYPKQVGRVGIDTIFKSSVSNGLYLKIGFRMLADNDRVDYEESVKHSHPDWGRVVRWK